MKSFKAFLEEGRCWPGHKPVPGKKPYSPGSCVKEDWQDVNKSDKTDGLSQKAVDAYRRENPGSKLQTAVTEANPSPEREKRRKAFCSRSKSWNGERGKAARKRWRC